MSEDMSSIGRWSTLDRLHRQIETRVERRLDRHLGLQPREFYALFALRAEAPAPAHQLHLSELADRIGLSRSATSRLVGRLRDRGLVATRTPWHDRRSVEVRLTPIAHDVLRLGTPLLDRAVHDAVEDAGTGDIDRGLLDYLRGVQGAKPPPGPPLPDSGNTVAVPQSCTTESMERRG
ncbi:MarR family winged helix-turn-helix transcriptional regulator [Streptomyces spiralis]|uniref:MarR family winged helix-turn-helix transcriptional regulator n=1 Tax=Streptomyces spiralis TaxID=66376 RepID=UPI0033CD875F